MAVGQNLPGGLLSIIQNLPALMENPLHIQWCGDSLKTVLLFIGAYGMGIGIYFATKRNTRRREEHGSAKWGGAVGVNRKYADKALTENKILTQNVRIGFDGHKHRRNLNVLICSGAGKTRFYAKPNVMNCSEKVSTICLDPKGEILRSTGKLLESKGVKVKVLDLINMHNSHCYNLLST